MTVAFIDFRRRALPPEVYGTLLNHRAALAQIGDAANEVRTTARRRRPFSP